MAQQTSTSASASVQIAFHQRMAQLLHDHATWAALATVVVLLAKYLFNLPITQAEVLTFFGIMATYLFGASWVATAHINAMTKLGQQAQIEATQRASQAKSADFMQGIVETGTRLAQNYAEVEKARAGAWASRKADTAAPPADSSQPSPQ